MKNYHKPLNIIFAGTPNFAAYHLKNLIHTNHKILMVLTQPDRINQRNKKIIHSPVKKIANQYHIPLLQLENFKNKINIIKKLPQQADIIIVIAYGIILPKFLLSLFPFGCINIHASMLPKFRGAAPIQQALLNQEKITGITAIQMNYQIDAGNILYQIPCYINNQDTVNTLTKKLCPIGIKTLLYTLIKIKKKNIKYIHQNNLYVTYANKLKKKDGKINFYFPAKKIEIMVRTLYPWPGTFIQIKQHIIKIIHVEVIRSIHSWLIGEIILINKNGIFIQTKKNILKIIKIQIPGRKIIHISEFINSNQKIFIQGKILKLF